MRLGRGGRFTVRYAEVCFINVLANCLCVVRQCECTGPLQKSHAKATMKILEFLQLQSAAVVLGSAAR
jgi:hypothetical protein